PRIKPPGGNEAAAGRFERERNFRLPRRVQMSMALRLVVIAVVCILATDCRGSSGAGSAPTTDHGTAVRLVSYETSAVNGYRLRLRYPASWQRHHTGCVSSFTATMVNLGVGEVRPLGSRTSHPSPGVT